MVHEVNVHEGRFMRVRFMRVGSRGWFMGGS